GFQLKLRPFLSIGRGPLKSKMEDRWLSVDEIGDYLGIKRDTVYKWISEKGLPAHKIGRLWKFKKDEVDTWVRDGKARDVKEGEDQ
ncbi:MAG: helix-turn-helix domain-containing protein, partial [Chlorobium phaeovibrioides]|nr:helix-turn-helix domain-containing protein [Chlorobium phaeovibrioides]